MTPELSPLAWRGMCGPLWVGDPGGIMKFYTWTKDLSVGSDALDGHHKMLIDCLNQIHPLIGQSGVDEQIGAVMRRLEEFVLLHFSEEEQFMRNVGYPDWREHKAQHDKMYDVVFDLKSDIEQQREVDARRLFNIIYDWLRTHIMVEDKKYADYLAHHQRHATDVWIRANGRSD